MRIGELLKKWRFIRELSTQQVADMVGVSRSVIERIESGGIPNADGFLKFMNWLFTQEAVNGTGPGQRGTQSSGDKSADEVVSGEGKGK